MNTSKFFSSGQESSTIFSSASHTKQLSSINKKVIKIDSILKNSFSLRKQLQEKTRTKKSQSTFQKRENELEKTKLPKAEKGIKSVPTPSGGGIFGWIGNFINNVIFGFIAIRLIEHLPKLLSLVPIINSVMNGIIDWGGKLLEGLITSIDWGYAAYDNTVKVFSKFGGEGAAKNFEKFMGKFQDVIQYSLIAGMLFSDLALSGGGDQGYDDLVDINRNKPKGGRPPKPSGGGGGGGGRGIGRAGTRIGLKFLGKGATKTVLKIIRPFTKRLPIIGALLDFGLSVALGEDPGRAAFKAIGAGLLGAVGAALGGPFALLTGLAGGWLGDKAGGALYDAFFGNKKGQKPSSKKGWFGMRNGGVVRRYAGGGSTRGGQYLSGSARREIRPQKQLRRVVTKPAKLYQGRTAGGIDNLQKVFPEPENIKSPPGTPSQRKDETMNPYGFMSHSYYRFASVPFVGPILAMPLKVMMGDTIDAGYYTSVGQGFSGLMAKAYDEGAFSDDFPIQEFDFEKIVSKSVQQLATREMVSVRSELMRQLGLEKIETVRRGSGSEEDCYCPSDENGGGSLTGGTADFWTLAAIASLESGHSQGRADVAQSIYNRLLSKLNFGQSSNTIKGHIIAPTQYSPVHESNPSLWAAITDRQSAIAAVESHSNGRGRGSKIVDEAAAAIRDPALQSSAASFVGGRTDFWSTTIGDPGGIGHVIRHGHRFGWFSGPGAISYGRSNPSPAGVPGFGNLTSSSTNTGSNLIASSSPAVSVSDCSCDNNNIPDPNGLTGGDTPDSTTGDPNQKMMFLHWTAGSHKDSAPGPDNYGYHTYITGPSGTPVYHKPYGSTPPYHTYGRTGSKYAAISASGMSTSNEENTRSWGSQAITAAQWNSMAAEAAKLAIKWGWKSSDINDKKVRTHSEEYRDYPNWYRRNVPGDYRWDLNRLYPGDPKNSGGDKIRSMIKSKMGSAGKFGGGPINEGLTKVHPGEFIIDRDSVDVFGMEFMNIINQVENKSQLRRAKHSLIQILKEKVPYYSDMAPDEYITVPSSGGGYAPNVAVLSGSVSSGGSSDSCPWKDAMEFGN